MYSPECTSNTKPEHCNAIQSRCIFLYTDFLLPSNKRSKIFGGLFITAEHWPKNSASFVKWGEKYFWEVSFPKFYGTKYPTGLSVDHGPKRDLCSIFSTENLTVSSYTKKCNWNVADSITFSIRPTRQGFLFEDGYPFSNPSVKRYVSYTPLKSVTSLNFQLWRIQSLPPSQANVTKTPSKFQSSITVAICDSDNCKKHLNKRRAIRSRFQWNC